MSNRRKLSPQQTAQRDQGLAAARNLAGDSRTGVWVTDYAPEGSQCCWCDCPMDAHSEPGFVCAGCPEPADWIMRLMAYTPKEEAYPLCKGHVDDAGRAFRGVIADVPIAVIDWEES